MHGKAVAERDYTERIKHMLRRIGVPEERIGADLAEIAADAEVPLDPDQVSQVEFEARIKAWGKRWIDDHATAREPVEHYLPEANVLRVFVLHRNVLRRFLDRHPEIKPDLISQKRRKLLPLVALVRAMMRDDRLANHVKTEKRIKQNMARLDLDAKYQRAIQEAILGR